MRCPPKAQRAILYAALTCLTVGATGCGYEVVESQDLARLKTAETENAKLRQKNAQLKEQITSLRNVGRFQIHQNGFRTWRLDTASGQDCILLTSDADWKKAATSLQGCGVQ
jgi:outer membrane lipopolysaccharide assembly protein LptE/RlpB